MVKPDVKRDYYADLDLSPNADPQEVTKAFRKLAILYHPDRNRGKEEEFVPKFQTIQTAHEVLADPIARAKYDEDRRKQGYTKSFARPNNTTNNPYAQSFYRQPPRPPPPPRPSAAQPTPPPPQTRPPSYFSAQPSPPQYGYGQSPPFAQTPSPGTSRYAPFGRPAPPPPQQRGSREEYQRRAQEWSAWQTMHNKPPTAKTDSNANAPRPVSKPTSVPPPNKPGLSRSQTTKTPKKNGFDPSSLNDEWEPPASRTSSYTNFAKVPVSPMPPPPPGPPPRSSGLSPNDGKKRHSINETRRPVSADNVPFAEGSDRIRTPYSSHTGEKTYFSSAFLGRSTSVRDPPAAASSENEKSRRPVSESNTGRARSSSPRRPSNASTPQRPPTQQGKQQRANTAKPRDKGKGSATKNSIGLDYSSSEDISSSDPSVDPGLDASSDIEPAVKTPEGGAFGKPVQRNKAQPRRNIRNRTFNLGGDSATSSSTASREFDDGPERKTDGSATGTPTASGSVFNAPFYNPNVTPKAREEAENVDTQFSAANWHGKFQGSDFVPPPPPASSSRQTRSQTRRPTSPLKRVPASKLWFDNQAGPTDIPEAAATTDPTEAPPKPQRPPMSTKFSSDEWQKSFKAANWAFPPPPASNSTSPTRAVPPPATRKGSRSSATRKGSRVESKVPSVQITEEPDEAAGGTPSTQSHGPPPAGTPLTKPRSAPIATSLPKPGDNDAMDVDSSPPAPEVLKGPRLVKLQTARPEWRDGSTLLTGAIPPVSGTSPSATSPIPPPPPGPPPADPIAARPNTSPTKPASSDTSTLNLHDLSTTAPLAPSGMGVSSLSDLTTTLPFASKSSSTTPQTKPLTPSKLELPQVPKGPDLPQPGVALTDTQWKDLLSKMSVYMGAWYQFETKILDHFQARHVSSQRFGVGLPSDSATKLIAMVGEPTGGPNGGVTRMGLKAYQRELVEDSRVRKAYSMACERHLSTVEGFIAVKEGIVVNGFRAL